MRKKIKINKMILETRERIKITIKMRVIRKVKTIMSFMIKRVGERMKRNLKK